MKAKELIFDFLNTTKDIHENINLKNYTYSIYDHEYFFNEINDIREINKIYWEELLQRAHWAALCSSKRNFQWLKGIHIAIENTNFLTFSACLRCLLESSADNLYSLINIPTTLAENKNIINSILTKNNTIDELYISEQLENDLIHFTEGRKISNNEKLCYSNIPKEWVAKNASEYIKFFDKNSLNTKFQELYGNLCQYTHPASYSIYYLFENNFIDHQYKYSFSDNVEIKQINNILNDYNDEICYALQWGFNPGTLILKVLNYFNYELVKTPYLKKIEFIDSPLWLKIKDMLK